MALIRWQPFPEFETLRQQIDRMFDDMAGLKHEQQTTWQPAVEFKDTEDSIILRAEIPGVEAKDLY